MALSWLKKTDQVKEIRVHETDTEVTINSKDFTYTLDRRTGLFEQMQFSGRNYLIHPMELNIWRAPTDNDMYLKSKWKKARYDLSLIHISIKIIIDEKKIVRFCRYHVSTT